MSVTITLIEITPEIWKDTAFQNWISDGVREGEIPKDVPKFRNPTLSDIEAILEEFKDINVEQTRTKHQLQIVFSKLVESPIEVSKGVIFPRYYEYFDEIYVIPISPTDTDILSSDSTVTVRIDRSSGQRIDKFIQLLANKCGTYLLLHNGEPVQFFVPQTVK